MSAKSVLHLTAGESTYTYDSTNGVLTIKAAAITGDILITASAAELGADLTVTAANSGEELIYGTDYTYPADTGVLTILSDKAIIISNADPDTAADHRICVEDGVNANITLSNVNIDVIGTSGACAFEVAGSADCNLTLAGTNTLKSGGERAGLEAGETAVLTITEDSTGSLTAKGGSNSAGIGGGGFFQSAGTITIKGGTVTASGGDYGAGIGGGRIGSGGTIVISGGTVTASGGSYGAGIGNGDAAESGTFTTGTNGDAIIFASSVADKTNQNSWSGIIFEGNNGKVYGSQTLTEDFEISGDKVLDISENTTLSINTDVTLVNYGTINAAGTLTNSGELVNYGTITNSGTLTNSGKIGVIIDKGTVTGSQIKGDSPIDAYEVSAVLTNMTSGGKIYALWGEDYTAALAVSAAAADYSLPKRIKVSVDGKLLTAGDDTYTYDSETGEVTIKAEAVTGNILITADGLYNMAAADFTVSATNGGETLIYGIDYTYPADTSVLTILSDKAITISNADPDTATYHRICVEDGVNANVTFAGVNIHTQGNGSPFSIADHSTGDVTVTLADGTENVLISGSTDAAGLQKNGDVSSGTLTINGNGALTATGNWNGPGIGGNPAANIVIESGTIIANGTAGAGIGSTYRSNASNIIIRGGTVTAAGGVRTTHGTSYYGAGIGSGANGSASNIVITGGSVYATAQGDAQPIGKGSGSGTADAPTDGSGNPVYLYEIENPQKANITINGKDYPDTHGEDAKIYAYLPAKTAQDPNVVTVGDATTKLYYNSGRLIEVVGIPAADSTTFTYTGQEQTYTIAESDYYTISGNLQTNAGTHTVMVSLKDKNNTAWSDGTTEDKTYSFVIGKAMPQEGYVPDCELTLTENTDGTFTAAITPVDGAEYSFDGQNWSNSNTKKVNHKEDVTGYIRYAETDNYVAGKAASKTVKAGHGTLEHYNAAEAACTADGNIEYYYCPICKEYFSDAGAQNEIEYNDTVIEAKGHDFSGDFDAYDENGHWHICNREDCTATDTPVSHSFTSYIYNNDATYFENGTETAVCDAAGCEQTHTRTKEGTMLVDTAAPTGEIKVKENTWKSFINTITFDIFCKDKYDVIVTANDGETGVVSVEYLLSETAISESDIANKTGWKAYSAFSIEDEGKYIIYAKISDNAGNVIYISSDGMVIDKTVPVISGLQNNKTYCGEVTFTVDDEYIDYVTVNGARVNDYTLKADGTGYTVKAYDKAGNESLTYTVTVNDGHTFTDYVSNNDAACTEDGTETAKCDFCDATDTRTDIGSATGHTLTKTDGKPATHLTVGNTDYWYCDSCKKYFSDEAGINEIDLEDTVIPKLTEHTADGTSWHTDGDSHWHTCECGEVIDKAAHTYEWVIDRKATETEAGLKHEQCTVCSYAKAGVEIPATGSTPDQTSLQTGDDSNIVLWITVMLTAGAALTGTVLYSRKKKNSR